MSATMSSTMSAVATVIANDDGSGTGWLLVLGPVAAVLAYLGLWSYYRNTHRSHAFEREARVEAQPIVRHDEKRNSITGTKRARIDRENRTNHRQRVQRFG